MCRLGCCCGSRQSAVGGRRRFDADGAGGRSGAPRGSAAANGGARARRRRVSPLAPNAMSLSSLFRLHAFYFLVAPLRGCRTTQKRTSSAPNPTILMICGASASQGVCVRTWARRSSAVANVKQAPPRQKVTCMATAGERRWRAGGVWFRCANGGARRRRQSVARRSAVCFCNARHAGAKKDSSIPPHSTHKPPSLSPPSTAQQDAAAGATAW